MEKEIYYCYILSNKNRTVLYIGYTGNLERRIHQHKKGNGALFTKKYNAVELIYFEEYENKREAKKREKQLKNWRKDWKWDLIRKSNSELKTLEINYKDLESSSKKTLNQVLKDPESSSGLITSYHEKNTIYRPRRNVN